MGLSCACSLFVPGRMIVRMTKPDHGAELEAEANRILAEMDNLRSRLVQANRSGDRNNLELLEQMAATSRRFREVSERMYEPSERS